MRAEGNATIDLSDYPLPPVAQILGFLMTIAVFLSQGINHQKFSQSQQSHRDKSIQTNADVIHLRLSAFIYGC